MLYSDQSEVQNVVATRFLFFFLFSQHFSFLLLDTGTPLRASCTEALQLEKEEPVRQNGV